MNIDNGISMITFKNRLIEKMNMEIIYTGNGDYIYNNDNGL